MPIFDQGYQHWNGPLSSHAWRWLVVTRHGVSALLKGKVVRLLLFAAWVPALTLITFLILWGLLEQQVESILKFLTMFLPAQVIAEPRAYRTAIWTVCYSFFFKAELLCSLFLVMIVGPNLISRDLRFNALPLYFSRPLRRFDYFLGKLGVIGFFLAATLIVPAAMAYVLGIAFSLDLSVLRDTYRLLWAGALYGLVITVSAGTLMLAMSSLSRRSIYVGITWAGFCFLTMMLSTILIGIHHEGEQDKVFRKRMESWLEAHPAPPGVEPMGYYSFRHLGGSSKEGETYDKEAVDRWIVGWVAANKRAHMESRAIFNNPNEWRFVCSYWHNLQHIGDWLIDADSAWVVFGRTAEQQRTKLMPGMNPMAMGKKILADMANPPNDRVLADMMVLQFPWYWSASALGGLWLLSVFILTRRVKTLDRLK